MSKSSDLKGTTTIPFSEGFVEKRILEDALRFRQGNSNVSSHQTRPLVSGLLETQHPRLKNRVRLSIQPGDPANFESHPDHRHQEEHVTCLTNTDNSTIQYIALTQGREDSSYAILRPLHCELYYNSSTDSITFMHKENDFAVLVSPIIDGEIRRKGIPIPAINDDNDDDIRAKPEEAVSIRPFCRYRFEPGAWAVSRHSYSDSDSGPLEFQFEIYQRNYSLEIIGTKDDLALLANVAGSKRKYDDKNITDTTSNTTDNDNASSSSVIIPVAHDSTLIRRINNLDELRGGELVRMTGRTQDGVKEYQIRCLGNIKNATNSTVFEAKVTMFPNEHVLVKRIKGKDNHSSVTSWMREFRLHQQVNCDTIVPLLGVDARLNSLFIRWINAPDLSHHSWRSPESKYLYFLGTPSDAARVLYDISRALEHLAEHNIIHHDIKPANILYRNDGEGRGGGAVLIDFGLGSQGDGNRHNGGTPWYIPTEFLTRKSRSASEDTWALGVVLLYLLRLIPLPDKGTVVKHWQIKDAAVPGTSANKSMTIWLAVITDVVNGELSVRMREKGDEGNKKEDGGDGTERDGGCGLNLYGIVARMLDSKASSRITPRGIMDALETLNGQNDG
ncbi:kinase-like domain-containing protein [Xylaria flabelliformis]|nr:kinase-like domain-containing protein [Xylaria flabelliformis]